MDEEENIVQPAVSPKGKGIDFNKIAERLNSGERSDDSKAAGKVYYTPGFGDSQYDKNIKLGSQIDFGQLYQQSLQQNRALLQPKIDELGNAIGQLSNIIPEAIGGLAAAVDFEDYFNSNDEVGNWLTDLTNKWKESTNEALPIYRENPGESLDFGDSAWWMSNGSSLVQSIGGFAISGGVVSKGLQGLSKAAKLAKLTSKITGANTANKIDEGFQTLGTAMALNQAEAILEAGEVYETIYAEHLSKLSQTTNKSQKEIESLARQKAADAASVTVNTNRINILLNISSANLFVKTPRLTRNILKKESTLANLGRAGIEGSQESVEELVNLIASKKGEAAGRDKNYDMKSLYLDLTSEEAAESALLGFLGGMGQTVITTEGVNRINKVTDPETGEKMSVKQYNKYVYNKQQDEINTIKGLSKSNNVKSFTDVYNSLEDQKLITQELQKAIEDGDDNKAELLQKTSLDTQALNSFKAGTTEGLVELYKDLGNGDQKEGMSDDYKQRSQQAINRIEKLEKIYNKVGNEVNASQLYNNRALTYNVEDQIDKVLNEKTLKESELETKRNRLLNALRNDNVSKVKPESLTKGDPLNKEIEELDKELNDLFPFLNYLNDNYKKINSSKYKKNYEAEQKLKAQKDEEELNNKSDEVEKVYNEEVQDVQNQEVDNAIKEDLKDKEQSTKENNTAKRQSNVSYKALEELINNSQDYGLENIPNSVAVNSVQGSELHLPVLQSLPGFENLTSDDIILIVPSSKGIEVTIGNAQTGERNTFNVEQYNVVDSKTDTSENLKEDVNNNDKVLESQDNSSESKTFEEEQEVKLNKAKDASLVNAYDSVYTSDNYQEYVENPRNKVGEEVTFNIGNPDVSTKAQDAIALYNSVLQGNIKLSDDQLKQLVLNLPIKVNMTDNVFTHLPFESEMSSVSLTDAEYNVREAIISQALKNKNFEGITSKIAFQYPGIVKQDIVDGKPAQNNIMELPTINNDISKVEFYISDSNGNILNLDNKPNATFGRSKNPGSIFVKIPTANGKDFPLKLNIRRVNQAESDILLRVTQALLDPSKPIKFNANINTVLDQINFTDQELESVKQEAKILGKNIKNLKVMELVNSIVYEGGSPKNTFKINRNTLSYGDKNVTFENFEASRSDINDWLINNKNRNIKKQKLKEKTYKEFFANNVLSTDAKLGEPTFGGNTKVYIETTVVNKKKNDDRGPASGNANVFASLLKTTEDSDTTEAKSTIENVPSIKDRKVIKNKLKGGSRAALKARAAKNKNILEIPTRDELFENILSLKLKDGPRMLTIREFLDKYKISKEFIDKDAKSSLGNFEYETKEVEKEVFKYVYYDSHVDFLKREYNNNSDVNDIPSTDDKNKKC